MPNPVPALTHLPLILFTVLTNAAGQIMLRKGMNSGGALDIGADRLIGDLNAPGQNPQTRHHVKHARANQREQADLRYLPSTTLALLRSHVDRGQMAPWQATSPSHFAAHPESRPGERRGLPLATGL